MEITGKIGSISYSIDQSIIERLKIDYGVDAIKEIEQALTKEKQQYENQGTPEQGSSN